MPYVAVPKDRNYGLQTKVETSCLTSRQARTFGVETTTDTMTNICSVVSTL